VAGTGVRGFSGDGGPATGAELSRPAGIAVDSSGSVIFLDGDRVRRIGSDGVIKTIAGTGTTGFSGMDTFDSSADALQAVAGLDRHAGRLEKGSLMTDEFEGKTALVTGRHRDRASLGKRAASPSRASRPPGSAP
jgi:hypothetical protein